MSPLEEPSVGELIRSLSSKMDLLSGQLTALQMQMSAYVTQEQRSSDKELADLQRRTLTEDLAELRVRVDQHDTDRKADRRLVWSAVAGPVIVGVVLWLLIGGGLK